MLEDGDAFSASASFCGGDSGSGNTGGGAGTTSGMVETTGPAAGRDEDGGNVETASIDLNEDGAVSKADDDFAAETSEQGVTNTTGKGALPGAGVLPSTGSLVLPVAGLRVRCYSLAACCTAGSPANVREEAGQRGGGPVQPGPLLLRWRRYSEPAA